MTDFSLPFPSDGSALPQGQFKYSEKYSKMHKRFGF